jgi:hypothetical protein
MLSRRSLLRSAPAAAVAAPMAVDVAAKSLAMETTGNLASGLGGGVPDGAASGAQRPAGAYKDPYNDPAVRAVQRRLNRLGAGRHERSQARVLSGGVDPDIACLRSASWTTRFRMQAERDAAVRAEERTLGRLFRDKLMEVGRSMGMPHGWAPPTPYFDDDGDEE